MMSEGNKTEALNVDSEQYFNALTSLDGGDEFKAIFFKTMRMLEQINKAYPEKKFEFQSIVKSALNTVIHGHLGKRVEERYATNYDILAHKLCFGVDAPVSKESLRSADLIQYINQLTPNLQNLNDSLISLAIKSPDFARSYDILPPATMVDVADSLILKGHLGYSGRYRD
jgi:hypothetical protein